MVDRKTLLLDIKRHLQQNFGSSVKDVILFGSQARGDAKEFSDYDILIVLDQAYSGREENQIIDLCYDIDLKYDILLDIHLLSKKDLSTNRGKQPIFVNAIKSGLYA